jgi:tRNA threonylcarbamoyl adenosine modification protein (Sua5/YciO/YrdC/YwlC family)
MLIKLYADSPNPRVIQKIANALREGGLIIYPTDTVYAIGCDIFHARAVEKICKLKKEDPRKANLSFVCLDLSQVAEYAKVNTPTFKLMKRNLPGPFTFILDGNSSLPKLFKQKKTVGVRIPDNGIVEAIVRELGNPLMSMTLHDQDDQIEYTTDPELIDERYGNQVDLVIDGGVGGIQVSTIVDCTGDEPEIIRQGKGALAL